MHILLVFLYLLKSKRKKYFVTSCLQRIFAASIAGQGINHLQEVQSKLAL